MVNATKKELDSDFMKRINDWIFSQETPSDVTVCVNDVSFPVHTFPLVSKCGYIKKLLLDTENTDIWVINIPDIPGGTEGFELAAKFCYEENIKLSTENIATARCVAEYLEMTEEYETGNLVSVTEAYLSDTGLTNLSCVASILQSSGNLLPVSERVKLIDRCVDIIASMVTDRSHDSIVDWWAEELIVLRVDIFERVLLALVSKGFKQFSLGPVLVLYAQKCFRSLEIFGKSKKNLDPKQKHEKRVVLETIVGLLPREKNAMSISFLSMLLRAAKYLDTTVACRLELEKRMGLQLGQAVLDEILIPSFCFDGDTFFDVDTVQQIMLNYFEHSSTGLDDINYVSPLQNDNEKVRKLMETFIARIACDRNVSVSKFTSFAECIPVEDRVTEDGMYRAVDIYLKAHPAISDMDRKKVCSLMNCQKLSHEARSHAAQNERLPVQTMVQVLFYQQQWLKETDSSPVNLKSQNTASDEISSLRKENKELKFEIIKMKTRLKEIERSAVNEPRVNNGTGTTTTAAKPPLPPKTSLIRSMTKRLGKMTPFLQADGFSASTTRGRNKPAKDRRHSVS